MELTAHELLALVTAASHCAVAMEAGIDDLPPEALDGAAVLIGASQRLLAFVLAEGTSPDDDTTYTLCVSQAPERSEA